MAKFSYTRMKVHQRKSFTELGLRLSMLASVNQAHWSADGNWASCSETSIDQCGRHGPSPAHGFHRKLVLALHLPKTRSGQSAVLLSTSSARSLEGPSSRQNMHTGLRQCARCLTLSPLKVVAEGRSTCPLQAHRLCQCRTRRIADGTHACGVLACDLRRRPLVPEKNRSPELSIHQTCAQPKRDRAQLQPRALRNDGGTTARSLGQSWAPLECLSHRRRTMRPWALQPWLEDPVPRPPLT